MTLQQLIRNAEAKKCEISYDYQCLCQIGIKYPGKHVWHWFKWLDWDADKEVYYMHSYSQNTGKTHKGLKQRVAVQTQLGFYNV